MARRQAGRQGLGLLPLKRLADTPNCLLPPSLPRQITTQERARLRACMGQVAARMAHHTAAKALSRWRSWLAQRRHKAGRLQLAVAAWRSCQLRAALGGWRQRVELRHQQMLRLQHAVRSLLGFRLLAAWRGWQRFVQARRVAASKLLLAVQLWQRSHLLKAFRRWQARHAAWRERSQKLSLAMARWHAASLSAAWQAWASFVAARRAGKAQLAAAAGRLLNVRAAAAFAAWRSFASTRREVGAKLQAAVGYWYNTHLAAAFRGWQQRTWARQDSRAKLGNALAHLTNRSLTAAFSTWRLAAEHRSSTRGKLEGCVARLRSRTLWAGFNTWRLAAAAQQARVAKLLVAAKRWHQPLLSSAFVAWVEHIRTRKAAAGQLETAIGHWLLTALGSAFNTWRYQVRAGLAAHLGSTWISLCLDTGMNGTGMEGQSCAQGGGVLPEPCHCEGIPGGEVAEWICLGVTLESVSLPSHASVTHCCVAVQTWRAHCARQKELGHVLQVVVARWCSRQMAAAFAGEQRTRQTRPAACRAERMRLHRTYHSGVHAAERCLPCFSMLQPGERPRSAARTSGEWWRQPWGAYAAASFAWPLRASGRACRSSGRGATSSCGLWTCGGAQPSVRPGTAGAKPCTSSGSRSSS